MLREKRNLGFCKKGNVAADTVTFIVVLVAFIFITVIGILIAREINEDLKDTEVLSTESQQKYEGLVDRLPAFTDGAVLLIVVLLWLAVIVASIFIDSHPVFFAVVFIISAVVILLGMMLSNTWDDFKQDDDMSTVVDDLPITDFIFNNLGWYALAIALSIGVVLYAKRQ